MEPHVQRMIAEEKELAMRIEKLRTFEQGPIFAALDPMDQRLMVDQLAAMTLYRLHLHARVVRATK